MELASTGFPLGLALFSFPRRGPSASRLAGPEGERTGEVQHWGDVRFIGRLSCSLRMQDKLRLGPRPGPWQQLHWLVGAGTRA